MSECDHNWKYIKDWYGNPDIPNGTVDCSHWYCDKCDTESDEIPEGVEPEEER